MIYIKKIYKKLSSFIKPWHLGLIFFVIYSILVFNSKKILSGDEIFYYQQAIGIQELKFSNFQNTQPLLFPLILSLVLNKSIFIMRLISAFFGALTIYMIFIIANKYFNKDIAILTCLMLGFSKFFIQYSLTIHTETLFTFLSLVCIFLFLEILRKNAQFKDYLIFGVLLGLSIEAKLSGIFILISLFLFLLFFNKNKIVNKKWLISLSIAFLIFIPYLYFGGLNFLFEKTTINRSSLEDYSYELNNLLPSLSLSLFIILLLFIIFYKFNKKNKFFYFYPLVFCILFFIPKTTFFIRHLYPILPFLFLLIADFIYYEKNRLLKVFLYIFLILYLLSNATFIPTLPRLYHQAYYLEIPEGCQEIKSWTYEDYKLDIPFFEQPSYSIKSYSTDFYANKNYSYFVFEYLDEYLTEFYLDDDNYLKNYEYNLYSTNYINANISEGKHNIKMNIYNYYNIGGIGQVLICENKNLHYGYDNLFTLNEIF